MSMDNNRQSRSHRKFGQGGYNYCAIVPVLLIFVQ